MSKLKSFIKSGLKFNKEQSVKAPIVDAMIKYSQNPSVGFHIPGHTRGEAVFTPFRKLLGENALKLDMTDEFDNLGTLHPSTGPIDEAQNLAALAFGARKTFFLVQGSTVGNLALAMGVTKNSDKILVNRNCHRSILTGLIISGANPLWLIPEKIDNWSIWGEIKPETVEKTLKENPDTALVWITNPTYEGVVSDIEAISKICKKHKVPLIVDEAHGCLWNFSDKLPTPALKLGADAVVHSLHKTGGSMSQSSMLHIAHNSLLDAQKIEKALKLLHTTSPSMLLLGSLDAARANLSSKTGRENIDNAIENALYLRRKLSKISGVNVFCPPNSDPTKIFINVDGLSGKRLESILEIYYKIEVESASDYGLLVLSNLGNSRREINYLIDCLKSIAKKGYSDIYHLEGKKHMPMIEPEIIMSPRDAFYSDKITVKKEDCVGKICAEVIAECPPGISILLPGELITRHHLPYLANYDTIDVIKN